jgi:Flp pilus assembly protein TadG
MELKILNPKKSKAQAMVEFAIALPVLLALLYGILEAGRLMFMYSTVVNASRQAVRWGSTTGIGTDGTEPRYQDCDGIRAEAQKAGFIGAFNTVTIDHDTGPGTTSYNTSHPGAPFCAVGAATDGTFTPTNNSSRISVTVEKQFNPIVPNLVPFISRNIRATSSRTILVSIDIVVTPPVPPKAATTTLITNDLPDPSNVGQTVPVTVTVTGGSTTPTGTVTITGADANCTITLSGGTGTCNVVFNSGGSRLLNASYGGDSTHLASSDPDGETHNVRYPTVLAITSHNPDPSTTGQAVNVVVSVTSPLPIPNGQTINITGANTNCTITLPATSCNVVFTSTGEKTIIATYGTIIDPDYHSGPVVATAIHDVIVNKDTVTRITSDTPDPSELNQPVTVSVRVVGLTLPTGTVNITGADTNCSITLSNGTGSCTVIFTSVGGRSLVAAYTGNANSNPSTSTAAAHSVVVQTTTTTITAHTPDPSSVGQSVTVTATVTGGSTAPTGTIMITGADTPCTITLPATSCNVIFVSAGTKTLSAVYNGDTTHATSNTTATHTVNAPSETPVPSCNLVTHGAITKSGNTMSMAITNSHVFPITTGPGTVTWNNDRGHQSGSDKSLNLQSITIGSTTVWTGNSSNVSTILFVTPATIPANSTVSITLTFHQSFDNFDGTENIFINLLTPGCESSPIQS